jgi:hypothetical protein
LIGFGKKNVFGLMVLGLCALVPISRMYLGVHSANQILFGLVLGMIFLVLYKFVYQKLLFVLYWNMLITHHRLRKLLKTFFFHVLSLVLPIVFYLVNEKSRPVPPNDLQNLNDHCGTVLAGNDLQARMLTSCAIASFCFGIFYGFVLLMDTPNFRKYLLGLWWFENQQKMMMKIAVYLLCAVVPAYLVSLLSKVVEKPIAQYMIFSLSSLQFGLGLSYFTPLMANRFNLMVYASSFSNEQDRPENKPM